MKNRYVLITGASSGIGKELSRCFAREGASCFLSCHPAEKKALSQWAGELRAAGHMQPWEFPVDLAFPGGPEKLFAAASKAMPRIDVLVNNAGVMAYGNFFEIPLERQETLVSVNLLAYLRLMRLALPSMVERGEGRILNVSSVSAFQPTAHHAVYGAAKAFVQSLSEGVNRELQGTGVSVCTLNPSYTDTSLLRGEDFPKRIRWYAVSGLASPARIAETGFRAFIKGRTLYVPGIKNKFIHLFLPRIFPRRLANFISYHVLKGA